MSIQKIKFGYTARMPETDALNQKIIHSFELENKDPKLHRSHFFEGRYENIYIDRERIEGLSEVLDQATRYAAEILELNAADLRCGFWFNNMGPGAVTIPHTHDDDDELLSGVYYVSVPDTSAKLLLGFAENQQVVEPEAGKMVFFSPSLRHEVSENRSKFHRLSIGINFGLNRTEQEKA